MLAKMIKLFSNRVINIILFVPIGLILAKTIKLLQQTYKTILKTIFDFATSICCVSKYKQVFDGSVKTEIKYEKGKGSHGLVIQAILKRHECDPERYS